MVAELSAGPDWGDPNILDRLTLCLIRAGRVQEAIEEVEKYFRQFPTAANLSMGKRILERIKRQQKRMETS